MSLKQKWQERLFGQNLIKCEQVPQGSKGSEILVPSAESLKGVEVIGVYFSFANISLQCDELKQKLKGLYEKINGGGKKRLEVVQVVLWANTDVYGDFEKGHSDCLQGTPWLAMCFNEMQLKERLSRRYRIKSGVTTLVLLDSDGVTISRSAHDSLLQDPEGIGFPWKPRPANQVLKDIPLQQGGTYNKEHSNCNRNEITYEDLPKSIRGFYFCANWCPPCRAFTPQLVEVYRRIRRREPDFEIIFVSSDRSEESFNGSLECMPWLAVPWRRSSARAELAQLFGVRGIPSLLLLDSNGHLVTCDARQEVAEDPLAQNFPWKPRAVNILTDRFIAKLYNYPAIILFVDGEETEIQFAESVLRPAADSYYKKHNVDFDAPDEDFLYGCEDEPYLQFLIGVDSETSDVVRDLTGLDDVVPLLVAVDIPNRKISVMEYGLEITEESVVEFAEKFQKGELNMRNISEPLEKAEGDEENTAEIDENR